MKQIVTAFMLIAPLFAKPQGSDSIFIGKKISLFSKVLNENRKVWVYTPATTSKDTSTDKKYPVVYLLDGDAHFFSTVGIIQQLSQANGNGILPEMIIVAIEHPNRLKDLTPTVQTAGDYKPNPFISFLSDELMPFIEKKYNSASYKILVGHSLGGLTAIDVLTRFPNLFNAYIAIDPSMWYNDEKILANTLAQLPAKNLNGKSLFLAIANTLPEGYNFSKVKMDRSAATLHIRSIVKLDELLQKHLPGMKYAKKYYENDNHNSVPMMGEYDGLRFIFNYYQLKATEKDFADSTALLAQKLKTHYDIVSKEMGYKVSPPMSLINYFGYDALNKMHYQKALALFLLNKDNYPNSSAAYNACGDYYLAQKDTINALSNYKTSLQIKSDVYVEQKLSSLIQQKAFNLPETGLAKYAGNYFIEAYKITIELEVRGAQLWSKVPGQPDSELLQISENVFTVKGKQGYTVTFEMSEDRPVAFTSIQPNGTFKAVFKTK